MTMRRSQRVRGRESDSSDATGQGSAAPATATRESKRARTSTGPETTQGDNSVEWVNDSLSAAKREEWNAVMKAQFYLENPSDVYDLFELASRLAVNAPLDAFVDTAGIRLTGPFDLLANGGKSVAVSTPMYLHGRFFLDPPEVIAVAEDVSSATGAHWGLYRDRPNESPRYIVFTGDASVCSFEPVALSLFSILQERLEAAKGKNDDAAASQLKMVNAYLATRTTKTSAAVQTQRARESIARSLHGLGIVVPVDAKRDSGYRELPVVGDALRDLLTQIKSGDATARKKLTNLITRATIANDECDFGTGLLLGLDLFTAGASLQKESLQMLRVAYMMLGRKEFAKVAGDHFKHRKDPLVPLRSLLHDDVSVGGSASTVQLP